MTKGLKIIIYFLTELNVAPPPDMTSFLQEERRLEQELYRQMQPTLYPESDHGSTQGESRDSGVELDNHLHPHNLHTDYTHEVQSCENHSRQNSEVTDLCYILSVLVSLILVVLK